MQITYELGKLSRMWLYRKVKHVFGLLVVGYDALPRVAAQLTV